MLMSQISHKSSLKAPEMKPDDVSYQLLSPFLFFFPFIRSLRSVRSQVYSCSWGSNTIFPLLLQVFPHQCHHRLLRTDGESMLKAAQQQDP